MTEQPVSTSNQPSQALAHSAADIGALRDQVQSGSLRLDPAVGEQLRSTLAELSHRADTWLRQADGLAAPSPLGHNPVGTAMAAKFASRAHNEDESLSAVLTRYRQVLADAQDAVTDAIRQYHAVDQAGADSFRTLAR